MALFATISVLLTLLVLAVVLPPLLRDSRPLAPVSYTHLDVYKR